MIKTDFESYYHLPQMVPFLIASHILLLPLVFTVFLVTSNNKKKCELQYYTFFAVHFVGGGGVSRGARDARKITVW